MEDLIEFIQMRYDEHEESLSQLFHKYGHGDTFDNEDTAMMDYHEGAVESLGIVLNKAKELYNAGN